VPDKSEIAWAAGFYEGEGWAGVVARSCRVTIGQKEDWCLERLRRYWGGTIDHPKNHVGMWRVSGTLAQNLLRAIYDDLSPRRQAQADRALASTSPVLDA
jgi:hypothetical protein